MTDEQPTPRNAADPSTDPDVDRRSYLRGLVATAGASALTGCSTVRTGSGSREVTDTTSAVSSSAATDSSPETTEESTDADLVTSLERLTIPVENLSPLATAVADTSVVGLGEATHGTREFDVLRRRLVQRLVTEQGLRAVAVEDNLASLQAADDYVRRGEGSLDEAMASFLHGFPFATREMRALLEWLRQFNSGRPPDDRVGVYGFDIQASAPLATTVRSYIDQVDAEFAATVADQLSPIANGPTYNFRLDTSTIETGRQTVTDLRERLEAERAAYVAASSELAWERAYRSLRGLDSSLRMAATPSDDTVQRVERRDRAMADNVARLVETAPGDAVAAWAHNSHVRRTAATWLPTSDRPKTMGGFLADRYGSGYYALGATFGTGTVTARGTDGTVSQFEVSEPATGSLAEILVAVDPPQFFIDLRSVDGPSPAAAWLVESHWIHFVAGQWPDNLGGTSELRPVEAFDGLSFVRSATATMPVS
jgi:erythromycin esterase